MLVKLIDRISALGIRSIAGEKYRDILNNDTYTISPNKRRIGVGKYPITSSLLVIYKSSDILERIYVRNHMEDIFIKLKK